MTEMPSRPRFVRTNGLSIAFRELGEGPAVLLLHGFPELAYSWRHQVPSLAEAGWRAIAPDLRGYGDTRPHRAPLEAFSMRNLCRDMLGLLDELAIERAVVVGHDFGGALAWSLARDHPDRVAAVASLNTPYTRRGPVDLAETMRRHKGDDNYMVSFQQPGIGEAWLGADVEATFRGMMRRPAMSLDQFANADPRLHRLPMSLFTGEPDLMGEPVMRDEELQRYVGAFRRGGFTGPLNWYRNLHQNWLDTADSDDMVRVPALMISAADDFYLPPSTTRGMKQHVPDIEFHTIADCGHWTQHEKPAEVNALLLDWLERRARPRLWSVETLAATPTRVI